MHSRQLREQLDAAVADGWQIDQETPDRVVLVRRNYGSVGVHVLLALFTAWWSFAAFNLLYAGYCYLEESERRVLREPSERRALRESSERICPECGAASRPDAEFCRECGTDLGGVATRGAPGETAGEPMTCPECDAVVDDGARYCANCGAELPETAARRRDESSE